MLHVTGQPSINVGIAAYGVWQPSDMAVQWHERKHPVHCRPGAHLTRHCLVQADSEVPFWYMESKTTTLMSHKRHSFSLRNYEIAIGAVVENVHTYHAN